MILVWVFMQLGYAVMAMACSAMVGEMVPDKFRNAVATWRNVAMFAGSLAGAAFAAGMADHVEAAMDICAGAILAAGVVVLFVPPRGIRANTCTSLRSTKTSCSWPSARRRA